MFKKLQMKFCQAYEKYVLDRRQVWENLSQIDEDQTKDTIIGFLKAWNIRNVNRIAPNSLGGALKELNKYFDALRDKSLLSLNFDEKVNVDGQEMKISDVIKEIYKRLSEVKGVGSTSASKIMHGVIPELFMMWDENIRSGYGYAGNEIGYLRFMREMQRILRRVIETYGGSPEELCHEAYSDAKKTLTKLLDEFNYMKFTRKENLPNPIEDC
ncbi:MAG: hypothetical protein QXK88_07255 [Desulfurococcaceae archaeon]